MTQEQNLKGLIITTIAIVFLLLVVKLAYEEQPEISTTSITTTKQSSIETLANDKLNELVTTKYWSHTNIDGCDFHCRTMDYTTNGKYSWVGENLYHGVCDIDNAYRLWKASPTHKAVLDHEANEEYLVIEEYAPNRCYIVLVKGSI